MKYFIFATLLAVAAAKSLGSDESEAVILRSDVAHESNAFSHDIETSNGIKLSESGAGTGPDGAIETQGTVSFTHPDGTSFELKYVANENGYQPQSKALPEAPVFPHPIEQYVLDQIAKAAEEDRNREPDPKRGDYVGYDRK